MTCGFVTPIANAITTRAAVAAVVPVLRTKRLILCAKRCEGFAVRHNPETLI